MQDHDIAAIDLLVVNLYPFERTVTQQAKYDTCLENIDIGGPAMIRAAAKNHGFVSVVVDPEDYTPLLDELNRNGGATSYAFRQKLALTAYARTGAYDTAVSNWLERSLNEPVPRRKLVAGHLAKTLRYGENPHQTAAFYLDGTNRPGVATAKQIQGKALSYNNINDTDAAFELVSEFPAEAGPICAIIKHGNPCGVASGSSLKQAYKRAFDCDRTSAFGGIIALNTPLDADTTREITKIFTEVVIAPGANQAALDIFAEKKNLRLLITSGLADPQVAALTIRQVSGGYLLQDKDIGKICLDDLRVVTKKQPSAAQMADMLFAWTVAKHVKSNAIIYVKDGTTVGIGAGQMSRVDSTHIAARKAEEAASTLGLAAPLTQGSVVASDAFFPFADGLLSAAKAGATAVIQPGGSMRDADVIAAANAAGLAMVFTSMRHFRH
jgi:phosphoribosylaminoimidazolecarboxamide formyltransferase/IMP cyclohydrolase